MKLCQPILSVHGRASPADDRKYPRYGQKSKRSSADAPEDHPEACPKARPETTPEITREFSHDSRCHGAYLDGCRPITIFSFLGLVVADAFGLLAFRLAD